MPDGRMEMASGKIVDPFCLRPEDIDVEDIACALSRICRFGGHAPYSVAAHSLAVADCLERWGRKPAVCLSGLMHDSAEAYLGDIPTPIKRAPGMEAFASAERRAEEAIQNALGIISWGDEALDVRTADHLALCREAATFFKSCGEWWISQIDADSAVLAYPYSPAPIEPARAERKFLREFARLKEASCRSTSERLDQSMQALVDL